MMLYLRCCLGCGEPLVDKRPDANACNATCRKRISRNFKVLPPAVQDVLKKRHPHRGKITRRKPTSFM